MLIVDADPKSDVSAGFGYRDCDDSNETLAALMDAVMKDEDIPSDCYIMAFLFLPLPTIFRLIFLSV